MTLQYESKRTELRLLLFNIYSPFIMAHEGRSCMNVMLKRNGSKQAAAAAVKHFNLSPYHFKHMSVSALSFPSV
jgi:hypothetical protein